MSKGTSNVPDAAAVSDRQQNEMMIRSPILQILADDLLIALISEWIDDLRPFDSAVCNKELRSKYLSLLKKAHSHQVLNLSSLNTWKNFDGWKKQRKLTVKKLKLSYNLLEKQYCMSNFCTNFLLKEFGSLQQLEILAPLTSVKSCLSNTPTTTMKLTMHQLLVSLPELETLSLSMTVDKIPMEGFPEVDKSIRYPLKRLRLHCVRFDEEEAVLRSFMWLSKHCPELEELSIHHCHGISTGHVNELHRYFPALHTFHYTRATADEVRRLCLQHDRLHTVSVTNNFHSIAFECPSLKVLRLNVKNLWREESLVGSIGRCGKGLETLQLVECKWNIESVVFAVSRSCRQLQRLVMHDCSWMTKSMMNRVGEMLQAEALKQLTISFERVDSQAIDDCTVKMLTHAVMKKNDSCKILFLNCTHLSYGTYHRFLPTMSYASTKPMFQIDMSFQCTNSIRCTNNPLLLIPRSLPTHEPIALHVHIDVYNHFAILFMVKACRLVTDFIVHASWKLDGAFSSLNHHISFFDYALIPLILSMQILYYAMIYIQYICTILIISSFRTRKNWNTFY